MNEEAVSKARKHHYISACYLKGFASPKTRDGRFYSFDKVLRKKPFPTTPNDAGCERDFNRIESPNFHPNTIEDLLGKTLENNFPDVVGYIEKSKRVPPPKSKYYDLLITMGALFAVRNPSIREKREQSISHSRRIMAEILVSSEDIWNSNIEAMRRDGKLKQELSFKAAKSFIEKGQFKDVFPSGYHIPREFSEQKTIFPYFYDRTWELLVIEGAEHFVCSNKPISLVATKPELVGGPLGFAMPSTAIIFPLTNKLCLVGTFKGKTKTRTVNIPEILEINSFTVNSSSRFIYSIEPTFSFLSLEGVKTQDDLLRQENELADFEEDDLV